MSEGLTLGGLTSGMGLWLGFDNDPKVLPGLTAGLWVGFNNKNDRNISAGLTGGALPWVEKLEILGRDPKEEITPKDLSTYNVEINIIIQEAMS
jgi:hypothetical protein